MSMGSPNKVIQLPVLSGHCQWRPA
uniref:Uncharacterized protein n=1 Tax=Anguilla anguilla TaxID=7936 RepID=A0A0E9UMS4_ANGAN